MPGVSKYILVRKYLRFLKQISISKKIEVWEVRLVDVDDMRRRGTRVPCCMPRLDRLRYSVPAAAKGTRLKMEEFLELITLYSYNKKPELAKMISQKENRHFVGVSELSDQAT